jgi:anti-sigma-K factor RskA
MTLHHIPQNSDSDDIRELLPAYAIGAVDLLEAARVEAYLKLNPEARSEVAEYAAAAGLLIGGVIRREPPTALRQKLLDAARAQRPSPKLNVQTKPSQSQSNRIIKTPLWAWISVVAAVVLLVMNVFWIAQVNELRARQTILEQTNQDQLVALQRSNQAEMTDAMTIMVTGTKAELMDDSGAMRAMVMWQPGHSEAVMFTHSLPPLDESRTYQLWLIDEVGTSISAGTFTVDSDGRATLMFNAQTTIDAMGGFGISVEPMGGSSEPTTAPLAISAL